MNKKITFIADFFLDEIFGGAELVNEEIIKELEKLGYQVSRVKCSNVTNEHLTENIFISNFIQLSENTKLKLQKCNYCIIEHDHKYIPQRDVSKYKDYMVPQNQIINRKFYTNAKYVYCQSKLHSDVVSKNVGLNNVVNLSTSIWSDEHLDIIEKSICKKTISKTMILNSPNPIKNTNVCIQYCEANGIEYDLVGPLPYKDLMKTMAKYETVLFLPGVLETYNKFIVEARMLGCKVITDDKNGCTSESWFSKLKGKDLIDFIKTSKPKFIEKLIPRPPANADKFNALFDKTYLINMASRPDRLQRSKKRLEDLGIVYKRFEAIDGKTIEHHPHLKTGEVGCYISHLNILKDAKQNNYQSILILEDDVVFENNMLEKFYSGYKHIPDDWEMIYLGANHNQPPTRINEYVVECNHAFTTSAIIIRGSVLERLLAESRNMTKQIDVVYADLQATKKLKAYAFHPWLMYQEDGYSDIQGRNMSYTNLMRR